MLFGIASFRGRVYPVALSVLLVLAGAVGFQSLLSPFGVPLGLVIGAVGVWTIRNPARVTDGTVPTVRQVPVG